MIFCSHNDDGSYTYGYEAADGSYKIETKAATGEVRGKYGYVDADGKTREVEYGANRNGFNPSGTGINVPPPVVSANTANDDYEDDGQYRPERYEVPYQQQQQQQSQIQAPARSRLNLARNFNQAPVQQQQPQYYQPEPQYQQPEPQYQQAQPQYQRQQPAYQPIQVSRNTFNGHPARNIDLNSGSYSIQY